MSKDVNITDVELDILLEKHRKAMLGFLERTIIGVSAWFDRRIERLMK